MVRGWGMTGVRVCKELVNLQSWEPEEMGVMERRKMKDGSWEAEGFK